MNIYQTTNIRVDFIMNPKAYRYLRRFLFVPFLKWKPSVEPKSAAQYSLHALYADDTMEGQDEIQTT